MEWAKMTREEAIEHNKNLRMYMELSDKNQPCKFLEENYIALEMAIKALERESVLNKIKTEIIENSIEDYRYHGYGTDEQTIKTSEVLQIIDKYRAENEED